MKEVILLVICLALFACRGGNAGKKNDQIDNGNAHGDAGNPDDEEGGDDQGRTTPPIVSDSKCGDKQREALIAKGLVLSGRKEAVAFIYEAGMDIWQGVPRCTGEDAQ